MNQNWAWANYAKISNLTIYSKYRILQREHFRKQLKVKIGKEYWFKIYADYISYQNQSEVINLIKEIITPINKSKALLNLKYDGLDSVLIKALCEEVLKNENPKQKFMIIERK